MKFLAALSIILAYLGIIVLIGGLIYQILKWWMADMPFHLSKFPAPASNAKALGHVLLDSFFFRSMWKRSMEVWASGWTFHVFLALLIIGHIVGISTAGLQFVPYGVSPEESMRLSGQFGLVIGIILMLILLYLLGRRIVSSRIRFISSAEDFLILVLLLAIVISGNAMRLYAGIETAAVRDFIHSIFILKPILPPLDPWFISHFSLVMLLLIYFPFSKLAHSCGIFMSRWMVTRVYPRQVIWK